jgi:radical SAM protein with 4Fe4S-binding SPASM domain
MYSNIELPDKIVYSILDQLAEINFEGRIGFFETNEPLTDKRIYEFISYSKKKNFGAWRMLASNGDLLNATTLHRLYSSGLDRILVSAYETKTIDKVKQLKKTLLEESKIIEVLDLRENMLMDNRGGNISNERAPLPKGVFKNGCDRINNVIYIRPTGAVVSCCCDYFEINKMGNVFDDKLLNIWNGTIFANFKKEIDRGNRLISPICSKCSYEGEGGFFQSDKTEL